MCAECDEVLVAFDPPDGTASRAREIPLGWAGAPQPLRSDLWPDGLPGLDGEDKGKVECANRLYQVIVDIIQGLHANARWIISNPAASHIWEVTCMRMLRSRTKCMYVDLVACNFGGSRPKRIRLMSSVTALQALSGPCSGRHPHRHVHADGTTSLHIPWALRRDGHFSVPSEAEFPEELCDAVLGCVFPGAGSVHNSGPALAAESTSHALSQRQQAAPGGGELIKKFMRAAGTGRQARGRGGLRLLPEYREIRHAQVGCIAEVSYAWRWAGSKGRRLTAPMIINGVLFGPGAQLLTLAGQHVGGDGGAGSVCVEVGSGLSAGIPWKEEEHFAAAHEVDHPFARGYPLKRRTAACVALVLRLGPNGIKSHRAETLARWDEMEVKLREQERRIHEQLPEDIEKVVHSKKLALFNAILHEIGYEDIEAARLMAGGFPVVGHISDSSEFPAKVVEPQCGIEDLWRSARSLQRATELATRGSGDPDLDQKVYAATIAEVTGTGLMRGPLDPSDLDAKYGLWIPARRFGLRQGEKVRPIDDFSENGQNSTLRTLFKVDLGGVDEVVAVARAFAAAFTGGEEFEVEDEDGERHRGRMHPDWGSLDVSLVGCCLDLVAAFRQLPRSCAHAPFTVISVFNPTTKRAELFELMALAFGQGAAVYGFNRVARALGAILAHLGVSCSNYVDDYPILTPGCIASNTVEAATSVLELLGWAVKRPGELVARAVFPALGVVIDVSSAVRGGGIIVSNRLERVEQDRKTVDVILGEQRGSPVQIRRLRGRLQYASGQTFGRCGAFASRLLRTIADGRGPVRCLTQLEVLALQWWKEHLASAVPRIVSVRTRGRPVLVFTDGAVEDRVTIGGVLSDPVSGVKECFGEEVPGSVLQAWRAAGCGEQLIGQAELAPIAIAMVLWAEILHGREVIIFVDNDSARDAMVKGYSPSLASAKIVGVAWSAIASLLASVWLERVPGVSNIADGPSRLSFNPVEQVGAQRIRVQPRAWLPLCP